MSVHTRTGSQTLEPPPCPHHSGLLRQELAAQGLRGRWRLNGRERPSLALGTGRSSDHREQVTLRTCKTSPSGKFWSLFSVCTACHPYIRKMHFCSVRVRTLTAEREDLKHFVSNSRGEEGLKNQLSKEEKSSCNLSTLVIISFGGSLKCGAYRVSGGLRR